MKLDYYLSPKAVKLLEENIRSKLPVTGFGKLFFFLTTKAKVMKAKINKWEYLKLKNLCMEKETINNKKTTYGMKKHICKSYIWKGVNIWNIFFKNSYSSIAKNILWLRNWQRTSIDIFLEKTYRWPTWRKSNQNHSEIPLQTCQKGYYQKDKKQEVLVRERRKGNPSALLPWWLRG